MRSLFEYQVPQALSKIHPSADCRTPRRFQAARTVSAGGRRRQCQYTPTAQHDRRDAPADGDSLLERTGGGPLSGNLQGPRRQRRGAYSKEGIVQSAGPSDGLFDGRQGGRQQDGFCDAVEPIFDRGGDCQCQLGRTGPGGGNGTRQGS